MADEGLPPGAIPVDQFQADAPPQGGQDSGQGITPAGAIPVDQFQSDDDKYGTYGQMAKTFGEHAANTATFGLSTKAEVASGLAKPEDIEGRSKANPGVGIAGDVAGIAGSLAVPGLGEAEAIAAPTAAVREAQVALDAAQAAHGLEESTETANAVINARKALAASRTGLDTAKNTLRAGDLLNPVQAASKIGKSVSGAAKGILGATDEVGTGAAKVLNYAKSIGATALGSGVEGALYAGLGNTITEDALGQDKNLNGEQLFSHIMDNAGTGFLTGSVLGGGLHLAGTAIPESVGAMRDGITGLKNLVVGTGEGDAGLVGALLPDDGASSLGKFKKAFEDRVTNLEPADRTVVAKDMAKALQTIDNNAKTSIGDIYNSVDNDAAKAKIDQMDQGPILDTAQKHINAIDDSIKMMKAKPTLYNQGVADAMDAINDSLKEVVTKPGEIANSDIVEELRNAKKGLQKLYPKAARAGDIGGSSEEVKNLYQNINGDIKNSDLFGDVAAKLSSADDIVHTGKSFFQPSADPEFELQRKDFVSSFFSKGKNGYIWDPQKLAKTMALPEGSLKKQNALNMLEQYYDYQRKIPDHLEDFVQNVPNSHMPSGQLKNMIDQSHMKTSEAFEKYSTEAQKADKRGILDNMAAFGVASGHPLIGLASEVMDFGLNPISKVQKLAQLESKIGGVTNQIGKAVKGLFSGVSGAAKPFVGTAARTLTSNNFEAHQKEANDIFSMSGDLSKMTDVLADNTKGVYDVAPGHALAIQQAAARATQFLASKSPFKSDSNPLEPAYQPSSTEMAQYNRYKQIVQRPMTALQQVKDGTITPETVEALQAVYPSMLGKMQQLVTIEAGTRAKNGTMPPSSRRLAMSIFLGHPINSQYQPQTVLQNQAVFSAPAQNQQPGPGKAKASKTGMGKMKMASRFSRQASDDQS